jgi:outer membrane protein OmpA-like peptidoglycan-associated protein
MDDRNLKLSSQRAERIATMIRRMLKPEMRVVMDHMGMGEMVALYDNSLPEGRTLGRCVRVVIIRAE